MNPHLDCTVSKFSLIQLGVWSISLIQPLVGNGRVKRPLKASIPAGLSRTLQKGSLKHVKLASPVKQRGIGINGANGASSEETEAGVDPLVGPVRRVTRSSSHKGNKKQV